jgi:hypothetical protein
MAGSAMQRKWRSARLQLAHEGNDSDLADDIENNIDLFREKTPLQDPNLTNASPNP